MKNKLKANNKMMHNDCKKKGKKLRKVWSSKLKRLNSKGWKKK